MGTLLSKLVSVWAGGRMMGWASVCACVWVSKWEGVNAWWREWVSDHAPFTYVSLHRSDREMRFLFSMYDSRYEFLDFD